MGVKGLQSFVQNACPRACSIVSLKSLANGHKSSHPELTPTIVVDAMGCLRTWYTPNDWIHGGQWKEYLSSLEHFIAAFEAAGIKLVFVFDGVIEQKKRAEWAKRRLRDNIEIEKIFRLLKSNGQQPGRNMFFIPSGIATFTRYALKALNQQIICTQVEADYEAAAYALQHNCLGILGEDSDYIIFNTVPYFSVNKLRLDNLATLMYSREDLCDELGIHISALPLLASLLGNDIVPENLVNGFHRKCTASYHSKTNEGNRRGNVIRAVASFISKIQHKPNGLEEVRKMLPAGFDMALLQKGIESYILPEQTSPWVFRGSHCTSKQETTVFQDREIIQIALEGHYKGENTMICNVLCIGESDCSNTIEDEDDPQIPAQALIFKTARQHIYAVLLGTGNGSPVTSPVVKEWYVYPGNLLQTPDLVPAVPLLIPGGTPTARSLWLSEDPDIQRRRFYTCMACFHVERWTEELRGLETHLAATCCLLIYLAVQVESLSLTDMEAFLAQALCLPGKSSSQLNRLQHPYVDSIAVHLAFLFLRGLITLMGANCACGYPFTMMDLMPWNTFDGNLFHQKYLQCHGQKPAQEILERNDALISQFNKLRTLITDACAAQGRTLKPNPKGENWPLSVRSSSGRSRSSFSGHQQSEHNVQYDYHGERNQQWNVHRQQKKYSGGFGQHAPFEDTEGPYQGDYEYGEHNTGSSSLCDLFPTATSLSRPSGSCTLTSSCTMQERRVVTLKANVSDSRSCDHCDWLHSDDIVGSLSFRLLVDGT
ncbi:PREDICTED: constitutive coactivator of peroxisome proliferator-activated receptor gamma [Nanorana parkeri]|uniref:constitutive coactivator of peroxisome proliferator-activated receptor gamma n=1 Tax=Nanorana parkeri TaxID=125878 RepID=UPI000854B1B2|nr:PREDICTED: constitutive coactivator of peroxisome proliferator-activated receptor gamma [Nanorana parkeri]